MSQPAARSAPVPTAAVPPVSSSSIIPALTGLRWVAALCVWLHHFPPPLPLPEIAFRFFRELHIGVPIFFVLSGFLITLRYFEQASMNRHWLRDYARNRFARIYPIYFLVTAVTLVVLPLAAGASIDWTVLTLNLTLLRGFFNDFKFTGVAQGWTLTVEECFYFSAPLMFLLWRRYNLKLRWTLAALYGFGLALWMLGEKLEFHGLFSPFKFVRSYTFFGNALTFLVGAWLARRFLARKAVAIRLPLRLSMTYCGTLGILLLIMLALSGQTDEFKFGVQNPLYGMTFNFVAPVFIGILIAGLATESTLLSRLLSSAPLILLGRASYCFYLIHMGFMLTFIHKALPKSWKANRYWGEFLLLIAAAIILYLLVEKPLNRLLRAKGKSHIRPVHPSKELPTLESGQ